MPELISEFKHVSNNWEIQSRREEEPLWIEAWAENQGTDLYKFYLNTSKEIERSGIQLKISKAKAL